MNNSKNNFSELSEMERIELFKVEELEPRLEMVWDDGTCDSNNGSACGGSHG